MFGRNNSKRFNECALRRIETNTEDDHIVEVTLDCPTTQEIGLKVAARASAIESDDNYASIGRVAVYNKSGKRVSADIVIFNDISSATMHLGKVATPVVCDTCVFANMSPVEVSEERNRLAQNRLIIAQNDLSRARALEATEAAYQELDAITLRRENPTATLELPQ